MTRQENPKIIEGEVVDKTKPAGSEKPAKSKGGQFVSEKTVALIVIAVVLIIAVYFGYPYLSNWFSEKFETQQPVTTALENEADTSLSERVDQLEQRLAALEQHRKEVAAKPDQDSGLEARVASLEESISQIPAGETADTVVEDPRIAALVNELAVLKEAMAGMVASQGKSSPGFSSALANLAPPLYQAHPYAGQLEQVRIYILDMPALDQATLSGPLSVLSQYANTGIVDIVDLRREFSGAVIAALRTEGLPPDAGWWARTWAKIKGQVVVRRSDGVGASTLEAVLLEAEAYLAAGEVKAALDLVSALPADQLTPFEAWISRAGQRVEALKAFEAMTAHVSKNSGDSRTNR